MHSLLSSSGRLAICAILALSGSPRTFAQSACSEDVTISSAADAKALVDSCQSLSGSLIFAHNLTEDVNLDGLEVVDGEVKGDYGDLDYLDYQYTGPKYAIRSSTLRNVTYGVHFFQINPRGGGSGLSNVSFPKLESVSGEVQFFLPNLTHLNLASLKQSPRISINVPQLQELKINQYEGQLPEHIDNGRYIHGTDVRLGDVGKLESVDNLFSQPIKALENRINDTYDNTIYVNTSTSIRSLTIGWEDITDMTLGGLDITLNFGTESTETMNIKSLTLGEHDSRGKFDIQRNENLRNLSVGTLFASYIDNTEFTVPFDQLDSLNFYNDNVSTFTLPQQAENWVNASIRISGENLTLDDLTTWHWPKNDMYYVEIRAMKITTDFFNDFVNSNTSITNYFLLSDHSDSLDCSKLEKQVSGDADLSRRLPKFSCDSYKAGSMSLRSQPLYLWACVLAAAVLFW